jgi:hypothetical protein
MQRQAAPEKNIFVLTNNKNSTQKARKEKKATKKRKDDASSNVKFTLEPLPREFV